MDFFNFQTEFLSQLKSNNKKCLETIEKNKILIQEYLGDYAYSENLNDFVNEINNIIVETDSSIINIIVEDDKNLMPFKNKFDLIEKVLKHPYFINVLNTFINSNVLIRACKTGNKSAVKWLLTMNVSPYLQDENGVSALMYAAQQNFDFVIKPYLYDSRCLNLEDNNGENVLFYSLRNPKFQIVTNDRYQYDLVLYSNININQINRNGESILTYCIKNNITEPICKFLLHNMNIDVNIADNDGKTAAMYLTEKGLCPELLELHRKNCNYDYMDMNGQSAMSILINKMYTNNGETNYVPYDNYVRIMRTFVNYQCDFNYPIDTDENTAFMIFLIVNDMITAKFCASNLNKLDLSVKNKYGESATSLCFKFNQYELLPFFKNNPTFDYGYRDPLNQNTLLMISVINNNLYSMKELLEYDPSIINEVNIKNENALIIASKINHTKAAEILLEKGINVNHQDELGNTALHYAVEIHSPYLIQKIMTKKPDIFIRNNEGKSPADIAFAIKDNYEDIFKLLTDPSYNIKNIKSGIQIDDLYSESIKNYIIPYANNDFPEYKDTKEIQDTKIEIYGRCKGMNISFLGISKELLVIIIWIIFTICAISISKIMNN
jgi:ankyrin repeat protein